MPNLACQTTSTIDLNYVLVRKLSCEICNAEEKVTYLTERKYRIFDLDMAQIASISPSYLCK